MVRFLFYVIKLNIIVCRGVLIMATTNLKCFVMLIYKV